MLGNDGVPPAAVRALAGSLVGGTMFWILAFKLLF
jgi:hypothetical protein